MPKSGAVQHCVGVAETCANSSSCSIAIPLLHCSATSSSLRGSAGAGKGVSGPPTWGNGVDAGIGVGAEDNAAGLCGCIGVWAWMGGVICALHTALPSSSF